MISCGIPLGIVQYEDISQYYQCFEPIDIEEAALRLSELLIKEQKAFDALYSPYMREYLCEDYAK